MERIKKPDEQHIMCPYCQVVSIVRIGGYDQCWCNDPTSPCHGYHGPAEQTDELLKERGLINDKMLQLHKLQNTEL